MTKRANAALDWIDAAASAAREARRDPRDSDALHRFRVNVRRLTVYLKLAEKAFGAPAKPRKRLRRTLRACGPQRDGHVLRLWLKDFAALSAPRRAEAAALAAALSRDGDRAPLRADWWRQVDAALREARRAVGASSLDETPLRAAQANGAEKAWRRLSRRLRRLEKVRDQAALHAARMAVKRLRYQLEAMDDVPRHLPRPASLRGLQAALGEAHDRDVIAARIVRAEGAPGLGPASRHALRRLRRERSASLVCARHYWKDLL